MDMTLEAMNPFAAISEYCKVSTDWGGRIDANMGIATRRIRTFASKEMKTGWDTFRGGLVGEVARVSCRTNTCLKEVSAHRHLSGVVSIRAKRTFGASA